MIDFKVPNLATVDFRALLLSASTFLMIGVVGCGGDDNGVVDKVPIFPVKGSVMLSTGKPLEGGTIEFVPSAATSRTAVGVIGEDGTFTLQTAGIGPGAAEGTYRIKIDPDPADLKTTAGKKKKIVSPIATKYSDEETSELTATVKPSENNLEPFTLKVK